MDPPSRSPSSQRRSARRSRAALEEAPPRRDAARGRVPRHALQGDARRTSPQDTIFGKESNAEQTWNDMLDEKQADAMAQTGQFGIAKMIEQQLRASVLASAANGTAPPPVPEEQP